MLVAEELRILAVIEDFKKKKKLTLEEVQNQIKISSDEELMEIEAKLQKVNINIQVNEKKIKRKCSYFKRGCCKIGSHCEFDPPQDDWETHLAGKHCRERTVTKDTEKCVNSGTAKTIALEDHSVNICMNILE